jgi:hypothetical protein
MQTKDILDPHMHILLGWKHALLLLPKTSIEYYDDIEETEKRKSQSYITTLATIVFRENLFY